jgi:hypothetical protein
LEVAEESLDMEEIRPLLSDAQFARLQEEASREGISVEELASRLLEEGVNLRYLLPVSSGVVVPFKALKTPLSEP